MIMKSLNEYFEKLDDRGKELLLYIQWLLSRQDDTSGDPYANSNIFQNSSLQVAQKPEEFKSVRFYETKKRILLLALN